MKQVGSRKYLNEEDEESNPSRSVSDVEDERTS